MNWNWNWKSWPTGWRDFTPQQRNNWCNFARKHKIRVCSATALYRFMWECDDVLCDSVIWRFFPMVVSVQQHTLTLPYTSENLVRLHTSVIDKRLCTLFQCKYIFFLYSYVIKRRPYLFLNTWSSDLTVSLGRGVIACCINQCLS